MTVTSIENRTIEVFRLAADGTLSTAWLFSNPRNEAGRCRQGLGVEGQRLVGANLRPAKRLRFPEILRDKILRQLLESGVKSPRPVVGEMCSK